MRLTVLSGTDCLTCETWRPFIGGLLRVVAPRTRSGRALCRSHHLVEVAGFQVWGVGYRVWCFVSGVSCFVLRDNGCKVPRRTPDAGVRSVVRTTWCTYEGRCQTSWKRRFKLPWREAGSPNHHDDIVDADQYVVNKELFQGLVVGVSGSGYRGTERWWSSSRASCRCASA